MRAVSETRGLRNKDLGDTEAKYSACLFIITALGTVRQQDLEFEVRDHKKLRDRGEEGK